jgi:hypothetical protein
MEEFVGSSIDFGQFGQAKAATDGPKRYGSLTAGLDLKCLSQSDVSVCRADVVRMRLQNVCGVRERQIPVRQVPQYSGQDWLGEIVLKHSR